jgi:uncharacterized protein YcnI
MMNPHKTMHATCQGAALALALLTAAPAAQAHITLSSDTAQAGAHARVVLRVPHGCGPSATTGITVHVPAGYLLAKPMPKPGWALSLEKAALKPPLRLHGREITETTAQVRWQGGALPTEFFDEFVLVGKLDEKAVGPLPFRVVQTCEQGQMDWAGAPGSEAPAPVLDVVPAAGKGGSTPSAGQHQHAHPRAKPQAQAHVHQH